MSFKIPVIALICCTFLTSCKAQKEVSKMLKVKEIIADKNVSLAEVSELLEKHTTLQQINLVNWDDFSYTPEVNFRIGHSNNQIWLKYYVTEESILAQVDEVNGGVANDSCVEFFFDPRGDGNYYNFEFSCIGMPHLAYGPDRHERQFVDEKSIVKDIKVVSSLGSEPFELKDGGHTWEITIIIPATILTDDDGIQLKGLKTRANFYKCGNKTEEPHYLSWNPVETERPDFHRPEYFGTLIFE